MTKHEFLASLQKKLSPLPRNEVEEQLRFYTEMIEDRMEEGMAEEEAVAAVGPIDEITAQIASDIQPQKQQEEKQEKRRSGGQLALLILGSPLWVPLLIAAFAVGLALYASLWAVIISLWAAFGSMVACGAAGLVAGLGMGLGGDHMSGLALAGASAVCLGLAIFLFFACKALTNATVRLTAKLFQRRKKEEAK